MPGILYPEIPNSRQMFLAPGITDLPNLEKRSIKGCFAFRHVQDEISFSDNADLQLLLEMASKAINLQPSLHSSSKLKSAYRFDIHPSFRSMTASAFSVNIIR